MRAETRALYRQEEGACEKLYFFLKKRNVFEQKFYKDKIGRNIFVHIESCAICCCCPELGPESETDQDCHGRPTRPHERVLEK